MPASYAHARISKFNVRITDGRLFICGTYVPKNLLCECGKREIEAIVHWEGIEYLPVCKPCADEMRTMYRRARVYPYQELVRKAQIEKAAQIEAVANKPLTPDEKRIYKKARNRWQAVITWIHEQERSIATEEIISKFNRQAGAVNSHLRKWEASGLIARKRIGNTVFCRWVGDSL